MKPAAASSRSSRMSIEVFDSNLLKETNLLNDDYFAGIDSNDDRDTDLGFAEISFDEFEKTLLD